jgi:hypothetical protein
MAGRFSVEEGGRVRDRYSSPSINFPQSEEEALQAILYSVRRVLFERQNVGTPPLKDRVFTTDAGMGHTRTQEQADWLNKAQALLRARFEDVFDALDLANEAPFA